MEHLAGLLKLFFEKGSWLAGVAIVALGLAVLRYFGLALDMEKSWVHLIYLVGAICGAVLLVGGVVTGWQKGSITYKEYNHNKQRKENLAKHFHTLPDEYKKSLVWAYAFDKKTFSDIGYFEILSELVDKGYLIRESPKPTEKLRTYTVADEIWTELQSFDRKKLQGILNKNSPPWRR